MAYVLRFLTRRTTGPLAIGEMRAAGAAPGSATSVRCGSTGARDAADLSTARSRRAAALSLGLSLALSTGISVECGLAAVANG
jgi:hypothetical protein